MTTTLYRPIGIKELELIIESDYKRFPPRLEWQPIFYPVMNQEYAEQIAQKWNTSDQASGYCGIVTKFDLPSDFLKKYDVQNVGGFIHNELWVPAEELDDFNNKIVDKIEIIKVFVGKNFNFTNTDHTTTILKKYLNNE